MNVRILLRLTTLCSSLVALGLVGCSDDNPAGSDGTGTETGDGDGDPAGDGDGDPSGDGDGDPSGDGDGDPTSGTECGNGVIEDGESCDGSELGGESCEGLGYFAGTLLCAADCSSFDESGCESEPVCGNGIVEGDELCDGDDFAGETCDNLEDFIGGTLSCSAECDVLDTVMCLSPGEGEPCEGDVDCSEAAPYCVDDVCWNGSETDSCVFNSDCASGLSCVEGQCWDGSAGDPCETPGQCSEDAPFCANNECSAGGVGDACDGDGQCAKDSPHCVAGACADGSEGSACINNGDCDASCVGGICYDGSVGDPCASNPDCSAEAPYCAGPDMTCQAGEVGSPCGADSDCISGDCEQDNNVCA
jgi:hypothetical protein